MDKTVAVSGVFAQLNYSNIELQSSLEQLHEACDRLHRLNGDGRKVREEIRSRLSKLVIEE